MHVVTVLNESKIGVTFLVLRAGDKTETTKLCTEARRTNSAVGSAHWPDGYAMLTSPNEGETAVHGFHCQRDMAVRMRKVMARPWVALTLAVRGFWDASFPRSGSNGNGFATLPLAAWYGCAHAVGLCMCAPFLCLHYFQCYRIKFNLFFINYCISWHF